MGPMGRSAVRSGLLRRRMWSATSWGTKGLAGPLERESSDKAMGMWF